MIPEFRDFEKKTRGIDTRHLGFKLPNVQLSKHDSVISIFSRNSRRVITARGCDSVEERGGRREDSARFIETLVSGFSREEGDKGHRGVVFCILNSLKPPIL
jgi:hypothetical protein